VIERKKNSKKGNKKTKNINKKTKRLKDTQKMKDTHPNPPEFEG
jgi:hypothetical protein